MAILNKGQVTFDLTIDFCASGSLGFAYQNSTKRPLPSSLRFQPGPGPVPFSARPATSNLDFEGPPLPVPRTPPSTLAPSSPITSRSSAASKSKSTITRRMGWSTTYTCTAVSCVGGEIRNRVGRTEHRELESVTGFDTDLGDLTMTMSPQPHTEPKLTLNWDLIPLMLFHTVRSGNNPGDRLSPAPPRPIFPLLVTSAPRGHTFFSLLRKETR